jgi:ABC-type branched-subunit amino acid transport system ATPase component
MVILQMENLNKAFGDLQAVHKVSLSIEKGELISIIGPNGPGKSTLFNLITGYPPRIPEKFSSRGRMSILKASLPLDGIPITKERLI